MVRFFSVKFMLFCFICLFDLLYLLLYIFFAFLSLKKYEHFFSFFSEPKVEFVDFLTWPKHSTHSYRKSIKRMQRLSYLWRAMLWIKFRLYMDPDLISKYFKKKLLNEKVILNMIEKPGSTLYKYGSTTTTKGNENVRPLCLFSGESTQNENILYR